MRPCIGMLATGAALLGATAVAAASPGGSTHIAVAPSAVGPQTTVRLSFTVPQATGDGVHDWIELSGPGGPGCLRSAVHDVSAPDAGRGVRVALAPSGRHGRWCAGGYRGVLMEQLRSTCTPGHGRMCPLYVIAPRTLATFRFRVRAS